VTELEDVPELTNPVLIAAFEGWNDAGDAATGAVEHLETVWQGTPLVAIDPEDYYDFQVNRPVVSLVDGVTRRITWPTSRFAIARPAGASRDVVILRGIEPNMRWRGFCDDLIGICRELGVESAITLGALLADSPHTRPVPVMGTTSDPALSSQLGLQASRYEGPTGIVGVFTDACTHAGLRAASFWAQVPHYAAQPPCPKATLALLRRVEEFLDLTIPLADLPETAKAWERGVDRLAEEDSDVADYVRSLEQREAETDLPEASGEAIAREFERYLQRGDDSPA
jgi:proteasome assembly chaperone (PAC2) family protein